MAFDVLIRALFSDQGLSVGLAKANAGLANLGKAGPGARRGLAAVEIGMRQLAFQAAGLAGGLGTIARGLLSLGGGSALVLGAAAGIGIVAGAYRFFTRDARAAAEAEKKFRDELHQTAEAQRRRETPESQRFGSQAGRGMDSFRALTQQIEDRKASLTTAAALAGTATTPAQIQIMLQNDTKLNQLYRERRALGFDIAATRRATADAAADELEAERKKTLERIEFLQGFGLTLADEGDLASPDVIAFRQSMAFGRDRFAREQRIAGFGGGFSAEALNATREAARIAGFGTPAAQARGGLNIHEEGALRTRRGRLNPELAAMSALALAQGVQSGSVGGFISAASGPIGMVNPLAGVITAGVGQVFSLFDNNEQKRHEELIRTIRDTARPLAFPERISLNVVGDPNSVLPGAERSARRDAVNRTASRS